MSIKGETETSNDSIALTGLYIDEKYCKHEPLGAEQGNKQKRMETVILLPKIHICKLWHYETIQDELITFLRNISAEGCRGESQNRYDRDGISFGGISHSGYSDYSL